MELNQITANKLIPVVVLNDAANADGLAGALVDGGLPVAEVTFRTAAAADSIRAMARRGDILVGAGTVITVDQVDEAVAAGASYLVSPGLDAAVVERARKHGVPIIPGAVTPTEIQAALAMGITTVKFFPAGTFGGVKAIKALAAPFTQVNFVPTGGVSRENVLDFLAEPCIPAVGGSWMVPAKEIDARNFAAITELTRDAVAAIAGH